MVLKSFSSFTKNKNKTREKFTCLLTKHTLFFWVNNRTYTTLLISLVHCTDMPECRTNSTIVYFVVKWMKTHPNLREVSELSKSWGGPVELQTYVTDSEDWPSSITKFSDSAPPCLWPLIIPATFGTTHRYIYYTA